MTSGDDPRAGLEPTTPLGLATDETAAAEGEARGGGARERLSEGRLLAGRWRIVRFIAAGGMGEVYEAEDATLGERVALKTIRGDVASDPRAVERFKREVLLARKVAHPNVCRLFELGTDGGLLFFTMELLEGETLAARIAARGRLAVDEARPIATQLCAALEAAHAAGIVHRDLKATNVILVGQRVVVTDFGLARALGGGASDAGQQSSMTGAFVGTPAYMAPEQVEGGEVGPAADLYALGVVLFEMLAGRRPFEGESALGVAVKRLKHDAPRLASVVEGVAPRWDEVVAACLAREPRDRPPSARAVAEALSGVSASSTERLSPPGPRRWSGRLVAGLFALVALGTAGAGIGLLAKVRRGPTLAPGLYRLTPPRGRADDFVRARNLAARYDPEALRLLDGILAADPDHAASRVERARIHARVGRRDEARADAARARATMERLPERDRAWVAAFTARLVGERAPEAGLRRLFDDDERCVECGVELGALLAASGKVPEAMAVLGRLRALPPMFGGDPRIALFEAALERDPARRRAALERAVAQTRDRDRVMFLYAARELTWDLVTSGELERAIALGGELRERAAATGLDEVQSVVVNLMAVASFHAGDFVRAGALLDESIEQARSAGATARVARLLVNRAVLRAIEGRPAEARAALDESARLGDDTLDDEFRAVRVVARATLALGEGRLEDARREVDEGLAALRAQGEPQHRMLAWLLRIAGQISRDRGDDLEARARLSEAREGAAAAHDAVESALAQLGSVRLLVDDGRTEQAARELATAIPWLGRMGVRDGEALAHALAARAELARVARPPSATRGVREPAGDPESARAAADRAITRLSATGDIFVRAELRTVAALVAAAGRDAESRAGSRRALEELVAELRRVGYVGPTWDVRLAALSLEDEGARRRTAAAAAALARDAKAAGYLRVARAAERLAAPPRPKRE